MNDNPSTTLSGSPSTAVSLQYFSKPETLREDFPFTYPDITVFPGHHWKRRPVPLFDLIRP